MNTKKAIIASAFLALMAAGAVAHAKTLNFSGYTWEVRPSGAGKPGPNNWDPNNIWVDKKGWLHLTLTQRNGKWYSAEIYTRRSFGLGRYQFWVSGSLDKLDKNVVFGLFSYPVVPDMGPDGTHEIDIEFAQWGNRADPIGGYTVWPTTPSVERATKGFSITPSGNGDNAYTYRFTRRPASTFFQSLHGYCDNDSNQFASWLYQPQNPAAHISQEPMPAYISLWSYKGLPPSNGQQVEMIVRAFKFTPM
ncbi:MAG: glycoside hydrolase family 16 protein [Burkholderiaceae bacterium]|jgi:hypothetical protein|nr:glycoside hydrolase family 16 protein [Burkholderiaceae bacterium]